MQRKNEKGEGDGNEGRTINRRDSERKMEREDHQLVSRKRFSDGGR